MAPIDLDAKKATIVKMVQFGTIVVALGVAAPFILTALEGLVGLVAIGLVGLFAWGVAGPLAEFVANKRIELLKAVIEANPIETMQNIAMDKRAELLAQSKAITTVNTQYLNVQTLINNLPDKLKAKAANYQVIADKLKAGLDQMKRSYDFAAGKLADYDSQIEEAQSLWEVACAINTAIKVSEKAKMDTFRDIKNKVAFDVVTNGLNHAFASLDEVVRVNQTITDLGTVEKTPLEGTLPPAREVVDLSEVKAGQKVSLRG